MSKENQKSETTPEAKALPSSPGSLLVARLRELSDAVTKGEAGRREFDMRIPAEPERDADLVLQSAARKVLQKKAAAIGAAGKSLASITNLNKTVSNA